ncbi:MAG: tetratricopeptide repeat protein, partial [Bacteroidales bacterium]|nr:tetratricopeptide repeat protein [Bacteroidales bacterium]
MQKSLEYNTKAYETYLQIIDGPSVVKGWLLYSIGLLHNHFGNHQEWKEYIYKSIANDTALFGQDHPELAKSYSSLTSYFIDKGMSDSALYYLEKSEEIERNALNEDHRVIVSLYVQHARIFRLDGNYVRALEYYQQALGTLQKNEDKRGYQERSLYLNMGSLYKSLGDYRSAEKVLLNLLDLEGKVHPTNMATNYYYLGDIQRLLGNYDQSDNYFRRAFKINDQYQSPDYHRKINHFLGYGILLDSLKKHNKAEQYYVVAVRIAEHKYGLHHLSTAQSLKITGDHYSLTGEHDKALAYYQKSIFSMVPDYDTVGFAFNPPPEQINNNLFYLGLLKSKATVLKDLAGSAKDSGERMQKMKAEYSSYLTSISIIDQLRNSYLGDRSKLYLSENERDTYEKCVESAYQCYELSSDPEYLKQAF